jgi:DNA polymerase-3 subunit alpha
MDDVNVRYTSTGKKMGFLSIQDVFGTIECTLFPDTYAKYEKKLEYGNVLYIRSKISIRDSYPASIVAENISDESKFSEIVKSKRLCIKADSHNREKIIEVTKILKKYSGEHEVCFYLTDIKKYFKPSGISGVDVNDKIISELYKIIKENDFGLID